MTKTKFIYMADGLFVHKTEDEYVVMNEMGFILKTAKTLKTIDNYLKKQLESRRAAERYANEINQNQEKHRSL